LELEIAGLGSSPSIVDVFLLVDPHEVDDSPSSNERGGDDNKDAAAEESASVGDVVLSEPNYEEGSSSVGWQVEDNIDEWVPPLNLIIEHEEELLGDLDSNEDHSENGDESYTSLQGDQEAAGRSFGERIRAMADAAAALRIDGSIVRLSKFIGIVCGGHHSVGIS